jgi:hypothetical protein
MMKNLDRLRHIGFLLVTSLTLVLLVIGIFRETHGLAAYSRIKGDNVFE